MCTLTYFPYGNSQYYLTHNRDELVTRGIAHHPHFVEHDGKRLLFPKDPDAGGTWIAASEERSVCLLNGAFDRYKHEPPYRQSRGIMLLDSFKFGSMNRFHEEYNLRGIAPFTMVIVTHNDEWKLEELKWDGTQVHHFEHDVKKAHIWSAATLYVPEVRAEREVWFEHFQRQHSEVSGEQLVDFHMFGGVGDPHRDLRVKRGRASTVSICQIRKGESLDMWYKDLINNKVSECRY